MTKKIKPTDKINLIQINKKLIILAIYRLNKNQSIDNFYKN